MFSLSLIPPLSLSLSTHKRTNKQNHSLVYGTNNPPLLIKHYIDKTVQWSRKPDTSICKAGIMRIEIQNHDMDINAR